MKNIKNEIQQAINLYKSQNFSSAEEFCKKLIKLNPKIAFLFNLLGLILSAQRRNDEAIEYYKKGISLQPDYAMIYNNLGSAYKIKKKYLDSEKYYKKSIELDKKTPEAQNNLGSLYNELNRHDEAIICYKKSININPKFYIAYYNLAVLYKSLGKFDECKKYLKETIKLYPNFYIAHRVYSQIIKYKSNDAHLKQMKTLYEKNNSEFGKGELAFGLGKAYDDIGRFEKAITYFNTGNEIRRKVIKFSIDREKKEFENIKKIFNKDFLVKSKNSLNNDITPIFILGMPRSGTTLVEQIISSHPDVYGGDELNTFNELIKKYFYKDDIISSELVNKNTNQSFTKIESDYLDKIKKISKNSKRVSDKLPINFKWIGFIYLILPKSKIIHCVRNPKDTCLSIYKNYFTNNELNYAYNINEVIEFYKLYQNLMDFWKKNIPDFIIDIEYEKLIKNPKKEISSLINECNLSWNDKCTKFYNNERQIKTASDTQARKKIYSNSINSWKNYKKFLEQDFAKL